jgi:hypothetical protein
MAKDPLGHGSNGRGGTGTQGMRLIKTHTLGPHTAKVYNNPDWEEKVVKFFKDGVYQPKADYHTDDIGDAHATATYGLERQARLDAGKSAQAPVHDSMANKPGYNEHGSRHGYSPDAVNAAIASSNRAGRRIGGKEASAIHRLLKGR